MKKENDNSIVITASDLKKLYARHTCLIRQIAVGLSVIVLLMILVRPPLYRAESTFQQHADQRDISYDMKDLFQHLLSTPSENAAIAIMQTQSVLQGVIEELGLQASVKMDSGISRLFKNIKDNFVAEMGGFIREVPSFEFADVHYEGEERIKFFIRPLSETSYEILNLKKEVLEVGVVGQPLFLNSQNLSFTMKHLPLGALKTLFPLKIEPCIKQIQNMKKGLKIRPGKVDKSILRLSFTHPNRFIAARFLNRVMTGFQLFFKSENEAQCSAQVEYLEKRQKELTTSLDRALQEHVAYLKEGAGEEGFLGLSEEIGILSQPKSHYTSRLFELDLQLKRLSNRASDFSESSPSLSEEPLQMQLTHLRQEEASMASLLEEGKISEKIHDLAKHLRQKREVVEEDLALKCAPDQAFGGLTLETAQTLYSDYTQKRDALHSEVRQLLFLRDQIPLPDFELSSLGTLLADSVTSDLISKASALSLELQDESNRSLKEQERVKSALEMQKRFLVNHLTQTIELTKLRSKIIEDKLKTLQKTTVTLLESERLLVKHKLFELSQKMQDLPEKWRRENLLLLNKELGMHMIEGLTQLTESKNINQHLYHVGSKPLDKAITPRYPSSPRLVLFTLFALLVGGLGTFMALFFRSFLRGFPASHENLSPLGFNSCGTLSPYCNGSMGALSSSDLEVLRGAQRFLRTQLKEGSPKAVVTTCILGKAPNYIPSLLQLLTLSGSRTLEIRCIFDTLVSPEEVPGLFQYLKGEVAQLPIRTHQGVNLLLSGSTTRHGVEIFHSPPFKKLIEELSTSYDYIVITTTSLPGTHEALSFLSYSDCALITSRFETKEDLLPYREWSEEKAAFIFFEEGV